MKFLALLFVSVVTTAQTIKNNQGSVKLDTVFCDCNSARDVRINGFTSIGKTIAPPGFGVVNEIGAAYMKGKYFFEKEHHSAWYKLIMMRDGNFVFDIIPSKSSDDYDFMLFKAGVGFCDSIRKSHIEPIRSCISRDKADLFGRTGLNLTATNEFVKEGVGDSYSKAVKVTKGEIFYLVLDNVYEKGEGHTIKFGFAEVVKMTGVLKDENQKPVEAELTLVDQLGDTIVRQKTGKDGIYKFLAPIRVGSNYNLNFYNDSSFTFTENFELKDTLSQRNLNLMLPKLKKGKKSTVGSINFYPNQTTYVPGAVPAIMNLYKLMRRNEKLRIMIIGHSNGRDQYPSEEMIIAFTKQRAATIKNFLVKKGIDPKRIETDGKGDHEMLFKPVNMISQKQAEMNRRVEIMVLEY